MWLVFCQLFSVRGCFLPLKGTLICDEFSAAGRVLWWKGTWNLELRDEPWMLGA